MNGFSRLLAVLALVGISATASFAGSADRISLHVPFAFTVGKQVLPAGTYDVRPLSSTRVALVDRENRRTTMILAMAAQAAEMATTAKLVFHRYGDQYFLAEVWTPERNQHHELYTSPAEQKLQKQLENGGENRLAGSVAKPERVTIVATR